MASGLGWGVDSSHPPGAFVSVKGVTPRSAELDVCQWGAMLRASPALSCHDTEHGPSKPSKDLLQTHLRAPSCC